MKYWNDEFNEIWNSIGLLFYFFFISFFQSLFLSVSPEFNDQSSAFLFLQAVAFIDLTQFSVTITDTNSTWPLTPLTSLTWNYETTAAVLHSTGNLFTIIITIIIIIIIIIIIYWVLYGVCTL